MRSADLDFVKARAPILDLVYECQVDIYGADAHGLVQPALAHDQKTRCPIHEDGNPSAKVYVESNSVYCWVCGRTWDAPALIAASKGISVGAAVRLLLMRLGTSAAHASDDRSFDTSAIARLRDAVDRDVTIASVEAWLDQIFVWAVELEPQFPQLDEVVDACSWVLALGPADALVAVRGVVSWARAISPNLPTPPVESELERMLLGV